MIHYFNNFRDKNSAERHRQFILLNGREKDNLEG
jgi:hypothetical protein